MNRLAAFALGLLVASTTGAQERQAAPANNGAADPGSCRASSVLAETVMQSRQAGVPMHQMMDALSDDEDVAELTRILINLAYARPSYMTESMQQKEVTEFGNQMYRACLKATSRPAR